MTCFTHSPRGTSKDVLRIEASYARNKYSRPHTTESVGSGSFYLENFRTWKVLEIYLQGPGICSAIMLFTSNGHNCCHQVRFLGAGMPKMLSWLGHCPGPLLGLHCSPGFLTCCLSLYLGIFGLSQGPGIFCNRESGNIE